MLNPHWLLLLRSRRLSQVITNGSAHAAHVKAKITWKRKMRKKNARLSITKFYCSA